MVACSARRGIDSLRHSFYKFARAVGQKGQVVSLSSQLHFVDLFAGSSSILKHVVASQGPDERAHSGSSFPLSEMESQTQTAIKEALDAIHRARDQLQGATPDMQVILDTRNVREGCLEFLKRKPAYMLAYWDKEVNNF